ncbi:hypothetical protein [Nocardioides sp. HB32]
MRAQAPLGRLVGLAMICAGLGTASLATPDAASAATSDSPTAIGVAPNGTSYVGFSTGGKLVRVSSSGKLKGGVPLDQDEAVDGLFVTNGGDIWVDYETGFSLLGPSGSVQAHFDHDPVRSCDSSTPASRYGGITANGNRVYIANRCHDSMSVYARNGDLVATIGLPGRPRGITYGGPQAGRPAFVYVAVPDQGKVLAFKAGSLRSSSRPTHTYTLRRPSGGAKPAPAGLAVDKYGQLTVSDMANNALYLLDANHDFSLYRTLGHPPRASRAAGRLNGPSAIAQHEQDGGGLSGNLFIADTDNNRIQRWDTGGYTFWAKGVRPGNGSGGSGGSGGDGGGNGGGGGGGNGGGGSTGDGPANVTAPRILGTPAVGQGLTCDKGTWDEGGDLVLYSYSWLRDGTAIPSATSLSYVVVADDDGAKLTCRVRASNANGNTVKDSAAVTVGAGGGDPGGPTNTVLPTITGSPAVGQVLTCDPGTWTGTGNTFTYQWKRGTTPVGASNTYTVVAADNGQSLTCTVTASTPTSAASSPATSAPVVIGTGLPTNTAAPEVLGGASPGSVVSCTQGTWTGSGNTYAYQWKLNGTPIARAAWPTYTVLSGDLSGTLACTVTASNPAGPVSATSAPATVTGWSGHAPSNDVPPTITGTAAVGQTLTCNAGSWSGIPELVYTTKWQRDGADVAGATATTYPVTSADSGKALVCLVVVANGYGKGALATFPLTVPGSGGGGGSTGVPTATAVPAVTGSGVVGTALTCGTGTWTGNPSTYRYSWSRNGAPIPQTAAPQYVVLSEDVGQTLTCTVTAVNDSGSTASTSAGTQVAGPSGHAPASATRPAITGSAAVGQVLTCDPGTWTGDPVITYLYLWQRNGDTIANGRTYTVGAADAGKLLRCVVVAGNGSGKGAARSAPVGGDSCSGAVGVTINGGATETPTPDVQLSVRPPVGATSVTISNASDFSDATTVPLVSTCSYDWEMSSIPGLPMSWSVYVRFDTGPTAYTDAIVVREPSARLHLW